MRQPSNNQKATGGFKHSSGNVRGIFIKNSQKNHKIFHLLKINFDKIINTLTVSADREYEINQIKCVSVLLEIDEN